MKTAGVRQLKAHLSLYLREVQAGETILVTDHGQVVAQITRPGTVMETLEPSELRYRQAIARGLLQPATASPDECQHLWEDFEGLGLPEGTSRALLAAERVERDF